MSIFFGQQYVAQPTLPGRWAPLWSPRETSPSSAHRCHGFGRHVPVPANDPPTIPTEVIDLSEGSPDSPQLSPARPGLSDPHMRHWFTPITGRHTYLKRRLHSQYVGLSTGRLLARQWGDWVTVTKHWHEVAWREKGQDLESELAALRVLQLKRRRPLSPDVHICKRRCLHPPSTAAIQLTGSPDRDGVDLPFTQLTGSPIREIHF